VSGLRDIFEEVVGQAPPAGPISADDVFTRGRRRRRRRRTLAASGALAVAGAVLAGGLVVAGGHERRPAPQPAGPSPTAAPSADPQGGRRIIWTGAADSRHLYRSYAACVDAGCRQGVGKLTVQLAGSDDGGRTWTDRGEPLGVTSLSVAGPGKLVAVVLTTPSGTATVTTSTDGGRSWTDTRPSAEVPVLPRGGVPVCVGALDAPCRLLAVDPGQPWSAPLASQPPLRMMIDPGDEPPVVELAGRLWARGTDRSTGRPAASSSTDGGHTWSAAQVFADAPACPEDACAPPGLASSDGPTVYAVLTGAHGWAGYRYTAETGWQRLPALDDIPYQRGTVGAFVTRDGVHVVYQLVPDRAAGRDRYRFWAERGGVYRPVQLTGLADPGGPVRRTRDGWYHTTDRAGRPYGSADGWKWTALPGR
jgi:hypothetical protein